MENVKGIILKALKIIKKDGLKILLFKIWNKIINEIKNLTNPLITMFYLMLNKKNVLNYLKQFSSTNPEESFNFISNKFLKAFKPAQIKKEFVALLETFKEINPQVIMEIGTAKGGSLFSFCKLAKENGLIISLDLLKGQFGGGYTYWRVLFYNAFVDKSKKLYLLRKNSHQQETLEEVKVILNGALLDFLFIDGDHTYDGVKKDFEMYSPLVKKGGSIALHDIAIHSPETGCFVHVFWKELKKQYPNQCKEIIKNEKQGWAGIGVFIKM